ncbi:hypothetical protein [Geofilum rhodophaeum]|uniref:hypothetical protein n=1 Tax=Geofilum rhodophaeum TaxID=1965019 RepID=UPI000B526226|nr:hypothetical protein [Geofilum rhodophaeum]
MENYLLELIRENNRIIIPDFGAFIVSRDKGQNILFNNFLSFNDGLLISHICAVEGIDSAAAAQKVEDYVAVLNRALEDTGMFEVKGIGRFLKDDQGVLRFEQDLPGEPEERVEEEVAAPLDDNDLLDLEPSVTEESVPLQSSVPTPPAPEQEERDQDPGSLQEEETKKRRSPVGLIVFLLLLLLLLAGAVLWFYTPVLDAYKPVKEEVEMAAPEAELPEVAPLDSMEQDVAPMTEEVVDDKAEVKTAVPVGRQHHVIVGSYTEEGRAAEAARSFVARGFEQAAVLPYEGRFLVSLEWHASVNQALQRQEVLLQDLQMENWVLSLRLQ